MPITIHADEAQTMRRAAPRVINTIRLAAERRRHVTPSTDFERLVKNVYQGETAC